MSKSSANNLEWLAPIGRALLAAIFVISGYNKLTGFNDLVATLAKQGLPLPQVFAFGTIGIELVGGIFLLIGFKARWTALVMALFLVPATLLFHRYWSFEGSARAAQKINFLKNLAIMGGLLMVSAQGAGRASIDGDR
jgi:putative oxidoreductase